MSREEREKQLGQKPFTLWITGLPRSGKTTLAFALEQELFRLGKVAHVLDGARLRGGLSGDLGFSSADRWEHQRRAAEVARLDNELGIITIVALLSPVEADRLQARRIVADEQFLEIHCNASAEDCEARDDSELYSRARRGEIEGLTGVDNPYEIPKDPFLRLDTVGHSSAQNVARVLDALRGRGLI